MLEELLELQEELQELLIELLELLEEEELELRQGGELMLELEE